MRCPRCNSQTVSVVPAASRLFCSSCGRWNEIPVQQRMWLEAPREPDAPATPAGTVRSA